MPTQTQAYNPSFVPLVTGEVHVHSSEHSTTFVVTRNLEGVIYYLTPTWEWSWIFSDAQFYRSYELAEEGRDAVNAADIIGYDADEEEVH